MKRLLCLTVALAFFASLIGCGDGSTSTTSQTTQTTPGGTSTTTKTTP